MSLLLFWSPAREIRVDIIYSPIELEIDNNRPMFYSIQSTGGVFGNSTLTYNETGITYNQVGEIYGGSDNRVDPPPSTLYAYNLVPQGHCQ